MADNIYQRLARVRKPAQVIRKNAKGFNYRYVSEDEILASISGMMNKEHISLIPNIIPNTMKVEPYTYTKTKTTKDGKVFEDKINEIIVQAEMEYIWVCDDNPEDRIVVPWILVGQQSDSSQAFGSGLTYATRYFMLKYFNVATPDDDPDAWRRKQKESESYEDKLVLNGLISQIDKLVQSYVEEAPDSKEMIANEIKTIVKVKGKASANYRAINDPLVASKLLEKLKS